MTWEQYSRRNCLRITGLKETTGENTDDMIIKLANEKLNVELTLPEIDRSHRIGSKKPTKIRSIIVKFATYRSRAAVIKQRRRLKDSGIVLREDLTKQNRDLLKSATEHPLTTYAWTLDGKVFALFAQNGREN